jgi:hypothetical protein
MAAVINRIMLQDYNRQLQLFDIIERTNARTHVLANSSNLDLFEPWIKVRIFLVSFFLTTSSLG